MRNEYDMKRTKSRGYHSAMLVACTVEALLEDLLFALEDVDAGG